MSVCSISIVQKAFQMTRTWIIPTPGRKCAANAPFGTQGAATSETCDKVPVIVYDKDPRVPSSTKSEGRRTIQLSGRTCSEPLVLGSVVSTEARSAERGSPSHAGEQDLEVWLTGQSTLSMDGSSVMS